MLNKKIASEIAIGIILLLAIVVGGIFYWQNQKSIQQPGQKACTMEAKLCNDGSYVSRTGPNCEFTECPETKSTQMANPASTYCVENGGESKIRTAPDGSQTGYCKFDDWSECEEWAYFRKECNKGDSNLTIDPASTYCEQNGGKVELVSLSNGAYDQYCKFDNGSKCDLWRYFRKECDKRADTVVIENNEKLYTNLKNGWKIYDSSKEKDYQTNAAYFTLNVPVKYNIEFVDMGSFYFLTGNQLGRTWFSREFCDYDLNEDKTPGINVTKTMDKISSEYPYDIYAINTDNTYECGGECLFETGKKYISVDLKVSDNNCFGFTAENSSNKEIFYKIVESLKYYKES